MPKNRITDFIFERKEDYNLFDFKDNELDEVDKKITKSENNIGNCIKREYILKVEKKLQDLINNHLDYMYEYNYVQGKLYYNSGFKDGVILMLSILFS